MKIAVFENEYSSVVGAFKAANLLNFNNSLDVKNFPSSQSISIEEVLLFDVIFIDIDLSSKSELDGYSLIKKLYEIDDSIKNKLIILTGNNNVVESLFHKGIDSSEIIIVIKPTHYKMISDAINKVKNKLEKK